MKIKVWVLNTCVPNEPEPVLPAVFGSEAEALAGFDKVMREEWKINGTSARYPGREKAIERMSKNPEWGQWELTAHEVDIPVAADFTEAQLAFLLYCVQGQLDGMGLWTTTTFGDHSVTTDHVRDMRDKLAAGHTPAPADSTMLATLKLAKEQLDTFAEFDRGNGGEDTDLHAACDAVNAAITETEGGHVMVP